VPRPAERLTFFQQPRVSHFHHKATVTRNSIRSCSRRITLAGTALDGAAFAGDVAGRLVPAELSARAFCDPAGARMRTS
jgi:hypothetical protein